MTKVTLYIYEGQVVPSIYHCWYCNITPDALTQKECYREIKIEPGCWKTQGQGGSDASQSRGQQVRS